MDKATLQNLILEKLGSTDERDFSKFLKRVAEYLQGYKTLQIEGIGHFQLQKEPISRMERQGNESEKNILVFLDSSAPLENSILSFDIENEPIASGNFTDEIFNIGIEQKTIIDDSNNNVDDKILTFIESGKIIKDFDVLKPQHSSTKFVTNENIESNVITNKAPDIDEDISIDDITLEKRSVEVAEARIDKSYLSNYVESETSEDEVILQPPLDDDQEISNQELGDTILETDELEETEVLEDGNKLDKNFEENTDDKIDADNIDDAKENEEESPFDEVAEYIDDDDKDEAQEILDEVPEEDIKQEIEDEITPDTSDTEEEESKVERQSYSSLSKERSEEWYKKTLLLALFVAIIVGVVLYLFWPSSSNLSHGEETTEVISNDTNTTAEEHSNVEEKANHDSEKEALNEESAKSETEKVIELETSKEEIPEKVEEVTKEDLKPVVEKTHKKVPKKLYRKTPNDQTVTPRIYTDGVQYTVQASSWKSTSIAEREVRKLKRRGFDAFIVKVYIKSKGSTWNRVRIGYFSSRAEAEEFLKKNRI